MTRPRASRAVRVPWRWKGPAEAEIRGKAGETINEALVELFRHKTWATLLLIEACQGLDEEMLDATTPGTYGTIRDTLHHLVGADQSYLATVTGERPAHPLPDERVSLGTLADLTRRLARDGRPWPKIPGSRAAR